MDTTKVNFRLPNELVERVDVATEVSHKNRAEIVRDALQQHLQELEDNESFQEVAVELYLNGGIRFETLKEIIGRQDAETVQSSRTSLNKTTTSPMNSQNWEKGVIVDNAFIP